MYKRQDYIEIPEGVNQIAVPYWKDDTSRTLYRYKGETEPGEAWENLYDPQKVISGKYYVQGVLDVYKRQVLARTA